MALGLQRNQEAISTDESLGAARAMMGWGHGGSVIIQIGLGRQRWDMQRGAGQEGLEMAQRQNLCVCVCVCVLGEYPKIECGSFSHLFVQLLPNEYLGSTSCFPGTVRGDKVWHV